MFGRQLCYVSLHRTLPECLSDLAFDRTVGSAARSDPSRFNRARWAARGLHRRDADDQCTIALRRLMPSGNSSSLVNPSRLGMEKAVDWYLAEVALVPVDEIPVEDSSLGGILAAYEAIAQTTRDAWRAVNGDDDETMTAQDMISNAHDTQWQKLATIVAVSADLPRPVKLCELGLPLIDRRINLRPEQILGCALPWLPLQENLDRVELGWNLYVRPEYRRRGIGRALLEAAETWGRQHGRSKFIAGSSHRIGDGPDALRPTQGELAIAPDAGTAFATSMGYQLAQTERHSVQDITATNLELARQYAPADEAYELHTFVGDTPEQLRPAVIHLHIDMQDAPTGEIEAEAEFWDEARLQEFEADIGRRSESVTTIAIEKASGEPGGYTHLVRHFSNPNVVYQWDTVVNRAHRGHGLGLSLKATTLLAAHEQWPQAERIHTWNASENDYMWRVNEKLGYRTSSVEAVWQKQA